MFGELIEVKFEDLQLSEDFCVGDNSGGCGLGCWGSF